MARVALPLRWIQGSNGGWGRQKDRGIVPPAAIAEMPSRRFGVEYNSLLENPVCARMWPFNTSLAHTRYGISLHVPRLHSDGAPGPRLPIRACTPGQKINRLVGRCRSTPCDPHEQIYRYIVHSVPREPPPSCPHSRTRQKRFAHASPNPSSAFWVPSVPLSAEGLSSKTLSGLEVGGVPRVRRRRSRTSRHMHGLWPTSFVRPCRPHTMTELSRRSPFFRHQRCILCGRCFVSVQPV